MNGRVFQEMIHLIINGGIEEMIFIGRQIFREEIPSAENVFREQVREKEVPEQKTGSPSLLIKYGQTSATTFRRSDAENPEKRAGSSSTSSSA